MTTEPVRIQLKRTKGWRLAEASHALNGLPAVKVTRPGKFGNPFKIGMPPMDLPFIVCKRMSGELSNSLTREQSVQAFRIWIEHNYDGKILADSARVKLRGKNLACFCKLPAPGEPDVCHAAVLLSLANT